MRRDRKPVIIEHVARLPQREKPSRKRRRERRAAERQERGLPRWPAGSWGEVLDGIDSHNQGAGEARNEVTHDPETPDPPER